MSVTLLATECPAVIAASGFVDLGDAENSTGASGATALRKFAQGDTLTVPSYLNRNVCAQELGLRYGGGANGIGYGLVLSAGSGLVVNVSDGHYVGNGFISEFDGYSVSGIPDNIRSYYWVIDGLDGTFSIGYATTTATPANAIGYIGSVLTASGVVVGSPDTSGVVYLRGMPYRETADPGAPGDSPPVMCLLTRTLDGDWLWDGTDWSRLVRGLAHQATSVASGKTEVVPAGRQAVIYETFDVDGTLDVYGDMLVIT